MPSDVLNKPDYWYVTDTEGMKFFKDERQLTVASWCAGAPRHKLEKLAAVLVEHFDIPLAPIKTTMLGETNAALTSGGPAKRTADKA